jgi:hypothetical protein
MGGYQMSEERLRELYARALEAREPVQREQCPPPEALLALARREGPEAERLETLDHVMSCARCRSEFDLLRSIDAAGAGEGQARGAVKSSTRAFARKRWTTFVPLALAATLVLAVALGPGRNLWQPGSGEVMRGTPAEATLLAPAPEVDAGTPLTFMWRPVPQARRYALEVLTPDGAAVFETRTGDTVIVAPRPLAPGEYQWWVRAIAEDGSELSSVTRRLRVRAK